MNEGKRKEYLKILEELNNMERGEASRKVTEILQFILNSYQPERSKREDSSNDEMRCSEH